MRGLNRDFAYMPVECTIWNHAISRSKTSISHCSNKQILRWWNFNFAHSQFRDIVPWSLNFFILSSWFQCFAMSWLCQRSCILIIVIWLLLVTARANVNFYGLATTSSSQSEIYYSDQYYINTHLIFNYTTGHKLGALWKLVV